ncbi:uncharacterized protein N7484_007963 [Penicillium longicatenatum]|uniref:uncharacterized protein n=1 Tax=Penicillium longicatenatum TaxID=1561947 RepID=UPI0025473C3D|nr:uncharacterized protein N7484_007963 [Penicillium longicatenatum]KAJ5640101.1 hypothetical protein N7484_007963 [Penicillium longicatenatum]
MRLLSIFAVVTLSLSGLSTALIVQGDPEINDPLVLEHLRDREKLITLEKTHRQEMKLNVHADHVFRQSLSPTAQRADEIVRQIRQYETDYYWRVAGTPGDEYKERFAGEVFPLARPYIANTTLWKIIKRMPKGALLHAHLSAMLPYEKLVEIIIHTEGMMIASTQSVDTYDAKMNATITFSHSNDTTLEDQSSVNIDSLDYIPGGKVPVTVAAANFKGGEAGFLDFIKMKTTVPPEESIRHELGVDEIWRRFQACFGPTGSMLEYEPVVRKFYQTLFTDLASDGINWVEIRSGGSSGKLVHDGQEDVDPSLDAWWTVLVEEINKFKATEKGKNFWGARIIWADSRGKPRASITKSMKIALQRKLNFPELFSGYDLVSQEDLGRPLSDLAPELVWFREQTEALNLTIPYFFHAGETLGDGNSTDDNLFDALLFNTRRIGHGFSLYKHPNLIKQTIEQNVLIEVCPISNEVLRLNTDILHHPLPAMIAHGIPTAISNDDPAILGQDVAGLSYDFYEAIQAFDNLGLAGLGALAQNSLRWANFEDQSDEDWIQDIDRGEEGTSIKAKHIQAWNSAWEDFCNWIVDEFASNYEVLKEEGSDA